MDQQKVGRFINQLRAERSLTQAALAEQLGVSNRSISRWENGTTMPDLDLLIELANYFDVEVDELLDGERKDRSMNHQTEETLRKVADYTNEEKAVYSRRMCAMFLAGLAGMALCGVIDALGLGAVRPYREITDVALGIVCGTLLTGALYSSRYGARIRAAKQRLFHKS